MKFSKCKGTLFRFCRFASLLALSPLLQSCDDEGTAAINIPVTPADSCYVFGSTLSGDQAKECCDATPVVSPFYANGVFSYTNAVNTYLTSCINACPEGLDEYGDSPCYSDCYDQAVEQANNERDRVAAAAAQPMTPKSPYPESCPGAPAAAAVDGTIDGFDGTSGAVVETLDTANELTSTIPTASVWGGSAATAAPEKDFTPTKNNQLAQSSQGGQFGHSSTGAGGAVGGSGGPSALSGSSLGGISTPSYSENDPASGASGLESSAVTAQTTGGGSAKKGGGKGLAGGLLDFGGKNAGATNGGSSVVQFGGRQSASVDSASAASLSADEYFAMIKITDSLFKVVEKRYTEKAREWVK